MRILICDDDKIFVSALRQNITECFEKLEIADYEIAEYYLGKIYSMIKAIRILFSLILKCRVKTAYM